MNLIKAAYAAAKRCPNHITRVRVEKLTDRLKETFDLFTVSCAPEDMKALTAAWTHVTLAMNELKKPETPDVA